MSDEAIRGLLDYVGTVQEGRIELDSDLDAVDTLATEIQSAIADIRSSLEEKAGCVESTLEECASDIPSDESNWDYIAEQVGEKMEEAKEEWEENASEALNQLEADIIAEHRLFADLCKDGYPEEDFSALVKRLFATVEIGE